MLFRSVTTIGGFAFENCSLTSITIPSSVTSIGDHAFISCDSLKSIYVYSITPVNLTNIPGVFTDVPTSICTLYVPAGSKAAYEAANQWNAFTHIVEMDATAIKAVSEDEITLSPNPTNTTFSINNRGLANLAVYNLQGNLVLQTMVQTKEVIPISYLTAGIYIVKIITGTTAVTKRLVVE